MEETLLKEIEGGNKQKKRKGLRGKKRVKLLGGEKNGMGKRLKG